MAKPHNISVCLTLSWRRPLSYRNQATDLLCKSIDLFLYDNDLRHERVKCVRAGLGIYLDNFRLNHTEYFLDFFVQIRNFKTKFKDGRENLKGF